MGKKHMEQIEDLLANHLWFPDTNTNHILNSSKNILVGVYKNLCFVSINIPKSY